MVYAFLHEMPRMFLFRFVSFFASVEYLSRTIYVQLCVVQ